MKVLLATDFFPPTITGSAVHVFGLARQLSRLGHQVVVATVAQRNAEAFGNCEDGVKVYRVNGMFQQLGFLYRDSSLRHHPPMGDPMVVKGLERIIKGEKPDVIHSHGWIVHSAVSAKREFDLPLIHTLHDYGLFCPKKSMFREDAACNEPLTASCVGCGLEQYGLWKSLLVYQGVQRSLKHLRYVDKFIAVSNWVKKMHEAYFSSSMANKTVVIPNFYDRCEVAGHKGCEQDVLPKDFVLFVGNLVPAKGVDILLKAFSQINDETSLVIIGKHHPSYDYKRHANQRVVVLPDASNKLVREAYSRCRFVVVPSLIPDPCPTVVLEAMGYRKAVIASDIGGLKDIVEHEKTGILVPSRSVRDLADALESLLADSAVATAMGQMGYERLNKFLSAQIIVPKIMQCYKHLLLATRRS